MKRPCSDSQVSVFGREFGSEHAASPIVYAVSTTNLLEKIIFAIVGGPLGPDLADFADCGPLRRYPPH